MRLAFKREPLLLPFRLLGGAPLGGALEGEAVGLAWVSTRNLGKILGHLERVFWILGGLAIGGLFGVDIIGGTYGSGLTTGGNESSKGFSTKAILTWSLKGIWF